MSKRLYYIWIWKVNDNPAKYLTLCNVIQDVKIINPLVLAFKDLHLYHLQRASGLDLNLFLKMNTF